MVAALEPVLAARGGLWLGWSGRTLPGLEFGPTEWDRERQPSLAWIDFPDSVRERYYNGFCNGALWPLFHSLPSLVRFEDAEWDAYQRVNQRFAEAAVALVPPDCAVWCHDFHLLTTGSALRARGHRGPLGLFLHIPFPGLDLFRIIPWSEALITGMLDFDVIAFQTENDRRNFLGAVAALTDAEVSDTSVRTRGRDVRVLVLPIGIVPEHFDGPDDPEEGKDAEALLEAVAGKRLILGVDRLDYTKGIPERLEAFARLLTHAPEWRGQCCLVQISVPSRDDIGQYQEQRHRIEAAVGRINGEFGETSWTPVRYLYRSYQRGQLSRFYRAADVCLVTPLRDGMNLVSKEFVAAQDAEHPGVLVLSRFAGAADEMTDAILANPFHPEGLARDLDRALRMPLDERRARHGRLLAAVQRTNTTDWAEAFLAALEERRGA